MFAGVLEQLARSPSPTVQVFEDLHWADEATLDLVKYLGRRIHRAPTLLVLSHRDSPTPEAIRTVADRNRLPVDRITEISVLDPYFYRASRRRVSAGLSTRVLDSVDLAS